MVINGLLSWVLRPINHLCSGDIEIKGHGRGAMSNDQGRRLDPVSLENQLIEIWGNEKTFQSSIEARRIKRQTFHIS